MEKYVAPENGVGGGWELTLYYLCSDTLWAGRGLLMMLNRQDQRQLAFAVLLSIMDSTLSVGKPAAAI